MFRSKKKPIVSSDCESKQPPIWKYFSIVEKDKSKASCNLCGGTYSFGSEKLKRV